MIAHDARETLTLGDVTAHDHRAARRVGPGGYSEGGPNTAADET